MSRIKKRYGILKHVKGSFYRDDCLVLDRHYKVVTVSRETAEKLIELLSGLRKDCTFRIVRLD